jgi:hypothetical protein
MSIKMRARLNDDLPFWFANDESFNRRCWADSVWYGCRAGAEKPLLATTIDADDNGLSLIVGTAV